MSYRLASGAAAILAATIGLAAPATAGPLVFGSTSALNSDSFTDTKYDHAVRVVGDGAGNLVAVWQSDKLALGMDPSEDDIFMARSSDGGATWTPIAPLNTDAASMLAADQGRDREPALATDRAGNWLAVWTSHNGYGGADGNDNDIVFARSTDVGATWTPTFPLNTDATTDNKLDERPTVAMDTNGHAIAAWQASVGGTVMYIRIARSVDAGASWADPVDVTPPVDSREDWQASVVGDGAGHWVLTWKSNDHLNGPYAMDGEIYVSTSSDDGVTWSSPGPLNSDATTDDFDDAEPTLATDEAGTWVAVWNSYDGIWSARSVDDGATWSARQTVHAGSTYNPHLTTDRSGTWVAVWHENANPSQIMASVSTDGGVSWSAAQQVNSDSSVATMASFLPDIATDGLGNWVVVWLSTDPLGGTGIDSDVHVATGVFGGGCGEGGCPGSRCAAVKAKATSKYTGDRLRCASRAMRTGQGSDPACVQKAAAKWSAAFAKAEQRYGDCPSNGDAATVGAVVDGFAGEVDGMMPDGGTSAANRCAAGKIDATGKNAAAQLACQAKALLLAADPSASCLTKAETQCEARCEHLDASGSCAVTGDARDLGAMAGAFAARVADVLR
jgi:hypothetical protein